MLDLFKQISELRKWYVEFQYWNELHISIVGSYFSSLSAICDLPELPSAELLVTDVQIASFFEQQLKEMFVVPSLTTFYQIQNRINKCHLLEAFLSLLLQLLYHKTELIVDPFQDGINNLEKELRFLLTVLGDISWMVCDSHELEAKFLNHLLEFEAVANEAGSFVHYLFFSPVRSFEKMDKGLASVLKHTHLLKANLQSSSSIKAFAYTTTPRTSIVDSILVLDSLLDDLEDLLKREDDPIADLKDQVHLLHQELLLSRSSIRGMRSPQPSEIGEVKEALMRIGGIAHQAEYLIASFLVKDAPLWYVNDRFTGLCHMVEPIRTELQVITQKYEFGRLKVAEEPLQDKRKTEVNGVTVGFEHQTIEILYQLVGGRAESLQVISILGMPGLGKTTLANKLYNHRSVNDRFDKLSWCVVSQKYERKRILADILIHINSEFEKDSILNMKETKLVELIHKTLMGRRYLIVLDDIWDLNALDELLRCFPDDRNGSRILVTSRNKDVAPPNSIIHELPLLSDDQCWELLKKKTFGKRACPPQLQGVGKKIAARCCGLPLTVVVIAGVLSDEDEEESRWEEVGGSLGSYIDGEDNSVMQILEFSYKHLPDHLKPCFLYFGEFDEDDEISVGKLKRLWVAEGFIRNETGKSAENVAGEYLTELIDKSLVMITKRRVDGRGAKRCVVHDLLHKLCLRKCNEERFLKYLKSYPNIFKKGNRVRVFGKTTSILSNCQHVRSLIGKGQTSYVRDMRLLRVLCYKVIHSSHLTFGIEYLVNLRFLVIHNLPPLIDSLVNLEYLRIELCIRYQLPIIVKMKRLRYLCAYSAVYGEDWNRYQTNNLEYLSMVTISKPKDEELLRCSPHLRKLKCIYDVDDGTCPHFDLRFLTQLDSLFLGGFLSRGDFEFPSNITTLTLHSTRLPWEKMSIVGRLEFLEVLKLHSHAFEGERWDTRDGEFQKLRFLKLDEIHLSEWNVASNEHFPKLQQLFLISCCNLQEIPSAIGEVNTLELIETEGHCLPSLAKSTERIKEEQRDLGNEDLIINDRTYSYMHDDDYYNFLESQFLSNMKSLLEKSPIPGRFQFPPL